MVINLYGGPCTGKSTVAANLFCELKKRDISCELVQEYATDLVYSGDFKTLKDQVYVTATQHHRVWKLLGHVEIIITDSPILMGIAYTEDEVFKDFLQYLHNKNENIEIFLERDLNKSYQDYGRHHTNGEALQKDREILDILNSRVDEFYVYSVENAVEDILKLLKL